MTTQYPRVSTQIGGITMCAKSEEAFTLTDNTIYIYSMIRSVRSAQRFCNKAGLKIKILEYGGRTEFLIPMGLALGLDLAPCSQFSYEEDKE